MEHISVKKKIDRTVVTHKLEKNEQISRMELDIIDRGEIPALLPVQLRRTLMGRQIRFVINGYMDLRSFLKSDIRFDRFVQTIGQIIDALRACESHGIRCGNLELSSDLAFYDYAQRQVRLLCWPLVSLTSSSDTAAFFVELGNIYTSRDRDSVYRSQYLRFFDSRARFDLEAFRQYLAALQKQWKEEQTGGHDRGGRHGGREDIPPTVDLRPSRIRRVSTQETIEVSRYPFTLGRLTGSCDYVIVGNQYVSKRHATIVLRGGKTYLRDNGSANGTFIEGRRLRPDTDAELPSGACFQIGNEDFIFYATGD